MQVNAYFAIFVVMLVLAYSTAETGARPDKCMLPKETGPCRAFFRRFYWDNTLQRCRGFIYGGCHGNANNFKTKSQCDIACSDYES
ncbi:hypothetical protein NP493_37g01015 [Ridgeia piscesae]|uniref:BPTI/Kunitz inhibitor domain-containing protein n=1 Tax=Ridgeia piscesae TaxID=27915 RepID=A0AAD9PCB3_RIDPI|nr:hypothetical protein NP493_37g01015 [Ridgeia piscesae]